MNQNISPNLRKRFSKKYLLGAVHHCFAEIEDPLVSRGYTLVDYLMSGLAMFSLKYASLLAFDRSARSADFPVLRNLRNRLVLPRMLSAVGTQVSLGPPHRSERAR